MKRASIKPATAAQIRKSLKISKVEHSKALKLLVQKKTKPGKSVGQPHT